MNDIPGKVALNVLFLTIAIISAIIYSGQTEWMLQKISETIHNKKGCNPLPNIGNISLHYFDSRGRAESIRMLLHDHMMAHEETRFSKEMWKETKKSGLDVIYAFGQVPYMQTNHGVELVQSHAILHFLGRAVGLDCDCKDLHHCEMVSLGVEDFRQKLSRVIYHADFSLKMRDEYVEGQMKVWLKHFEHLLLRASESENGYYFGGNRITWVDYLVFDLLETHDNFINATQVKKAKSAAFFLDSFPSLKMFYEKFAKRSRLANYLTSTDRIPYSLPRTPKV